MDHAGDIAFKLRRGFTLDPMHSDRISEQHGDRGVQVVIVISDDGGVFRVTIEDVGFSGLSEEELYYRHTEASEFE